MVADRGATRRHRLPDEGSGSSVTFEKDGHKANFHRPHPRKEALKYRVKQVREYLQLRSPHDHCQRDELSRLSGQHDL